ncbi:MAG: DUF1800 family protein [Mariniblastus sp.]
MTNLTSAESREIDPVRAWQAFEPSPERPWDNRRAAHLFRRAGFGGSIREIESAVSVGFKTAIDQVFKVDDQEIENEMVAAGRLVTGGSDSNQLAAWWLLRMTKTPSPFLEKLTLFWHGHFATGASKVNDSRAMFRQNQLLRKHALGKFEPFLKKISSNVAMLIYLDSEENRRTRPNENYARELLELFCLGTGNYTEKDIKEIARCFTGWEIRKSKFRFNSHQHDKKTKSFLGATGDFDGNDSIEVILKQPAAPQFIARKLIRFFVYDEGPMTDAFVQPVADKLRDSDFDIRETMKLILSSNVFYSDVAIGKKIKSPVELAVGFLRFFGASTNMNALAPRLASLGQLPLYPPNVKGWAGGKTWINASTILARANLIAQILGNDKTKFESGSLENWAKANSKHNVADSVEWMEEFLLATPLSSETRSSLKEVLSKTKGNPRKSLASLAALPEFQLN